VTPDQYRLLLENSDAKVRGQAEAAFQALLIRIRNGEKPQPAIAAVMAQFNAGTIAGLAEVFSALLSTSIGVAEMRDYPVGGVKLSDVLYTNAQAVSATTKTIIEAHMKGPHAARELAKALYEGYDFKVDPLDVAGKLETLPKYLKVEFNKAMAAKLKTPALRAAYLQAIAEQEAGKGMAAMEKVLKTAFYERNRYYANRIARTELHRAYTDQQSRELMGQDRIQYVQLRLSSKHPKSDICDYHAKVNLYGMGAGVYPKADAPKPPFHPHCYCVVSPKIDLSPKLKPRFNPNAERAFMAGLPFNEARQVAGSIDKRERILAGKATVEEVYNEGKDDLYKWKSVGDVTSSGLPAQTTAMTPPPPQKPTYLAQPSVKDAAKYVTDNNLADFADYTGVKPEVANGCNESLFEHIRDFPELRNNQKFIGTAQAQTRRAYDMAVDRMFQQLRAINPPTITDQQLMAYAKKRVRRLKTSGNTYAQSWKQKDAGGVAVNENWGKDIAKLNAALQKDVANQWHPDGTASIKAVMDHEFGHQLDDLLSLNKDPDVMKEWASLRGSMKNEVSEYAAKKIEEFIAESWAEYRNNPSPRPAATKIGGIILNRYQAFVNSNP
jgi:hypothetical protein